MHVIEIFEGNYFTETEDEKAWRNILEEYSQKTTQKSYGNICIN